MSPTIHRTALSYRVMAYGDRRDYRAVTKSGEIGRIGRHCALFLGGLFFGVVKGSCRMRRGKIGSGKINSLVLAGMLGVGWAGRAGAAAVAITYGPEDRSVSASSSATGFARGGTSSTATTNNQDQSQQTSAVGDFNGNVAAASIIGSQSAQATGSASQTSSLGASGFSASGEVIADSSFGLDGPAHSTGKSVFDITFNVPQAESYVFTASLDGTTDPTVPGATSASIALMDGSGKDIFAPISVVSVSGLTFQGTLNPGAYSMAMDVNASSKDEARNFVNYDIALTGEPIQISNGTAAPLPSSGIMALAMLSGLGLAGFLRRRIPGWVRMTMV